MDRFDKFTDRARKVLTLAQDEAQRFNHNYIGTEHLLLGLVREGEGVAARVLETSFANDCDCGKPGRVIPEEGSVDSVRDSMLRNGECDNPNIKGSPACNTLCACEIVEAQGAALSTCRSMTDAKAQNPAYCYVDPEKGLGDAGLVKECPATQKRLLRFVGADTPRTGSLTFMACQGSTALAR